VAIGSELTTGLRRAFQARYSPADIEGPATGRTDQADTMLLSIGLEVDVEPPCIATFSTDTKLFHNVPPWSVITDWPYYL
jgi:hypothetical protein